MLGQLRSACHQMVSPMCILCIKSIKRSALEFKEKVNPFSTPNAFKFINTITLIPRCWWWFWCISQERWKDEKREHCDNYCLWSITSADRVRVQVNNKGELTYVKRVMLITIIIIFFTAWTSHLFYFPLFKKKFCSRGQLIICKLPSLIHQQQKSERAAEPT